MPKLYGSGTLKMCGWIRIRNITFRISNTAFLNTKCREFKINFDADPDPALRNYFASSYKEADP